MNTRIGKIVVIIVSLIIGIVLGWIACLLFGSSDISSDMTIMKSKQP